ncbi:hypothetical protein [Alkalihalobacillus sp. TS-13]|uniref:hypothetical protein n=1 Tax=Alkalihalobacillus sp. TS-13 TaxID=2842455 RepID=UPI001C88D9F7|nr:hypothetical protein [Alkalihalobacillus sp. TS-13]
MVTFISIILGFLGAIGFYFSVGEAGTPLKRKKKIAGLWVNLFAQIPWVIFNIYTKAYGLFAINLLTVIACVQGLRELRRPGKVGKHRKGKTSLCFVKRSGNKMVLYRENGEIELRKRAA